MIPSIGTTISISDLLISLFIARSKKKSPDWIKTFTNKKYCYFVNSGTSAFYHALLVLRNKDKRTEVILPAYTAPSLILPIKQAGLTPRLCDISLKTFNIDIEKIPDVINDNTLAILAVHSFGLPCEMEKIEKIARENKIFLIDDAASAFGSEINGKVVGSFGDIGFFSFNRGKNITTFSGGCVVTSDVELGEQIHQTIDQLPGLSLSSSILLFLKTLAFVFAIRPNFYTIFKKIIIKFKYQHLHTSFDQFKYPAFQYKLASQILKSVENNTTLRKKNGDFLFNELKKCSYIHLPEIEEGINVIYNQFPVLFETIQRRYFIHEKLLSAGIESTVLYPDPIHLIDNPHYNLDYSSMPDPFPNATHFSKRLLLIPVHPLMTRELLEKIVNILLQEA